MYQIDNHKFTLKQNYTLNELDKLNNIFSKVNVHGNNIIQTAITNADLKDFLSTVLLRVDTSESETDYGKADEMTIMEIMKDFFLSRIGLLKNMNNSLLR